MCMPVILGTMKFTLPQLLFMYYGKYIKQVYAESFVVYFAVEFEIPSKFRARVSMQFCLNGKLGFGY